LSVRAASRKVESVSEQRRQQLQADRAKAPAMRDTFPQAGVVHIELNFDDRNGRVPSPQMHSLYPGARAFFRFVCPCADCDGDFDLKSAVTALIRSGPTSKRHAGRSSAGQLHCQGTRLRDSHHSAPCRMELSFRLVTAFEAAA
jgi:hypothetical protein